MILHVVEFAEGGLGKVRFMYNAFGDETTDRLEAEAIVVELADGSVLSGEVSSYEGLHPVH